MNWRGEWCLVAGDRWGRSGASDIEGVWEMIWIFKLEGFWEQLGRMG